MVDQNAWMPPNAGPPYRAPRPPPLTMAYPSPHESSPRPVPRLPSVVPGILLMVAGVLGMLLALGIIMIPGALFLLGMRRSQM